MNPTSGAVGDSGTSTPSSSPTNCTSSTMASSPLSGSPRNTDRRVFDFAPKSVAQSPENRWSINTANPSPSRQKHRLASMSRVQMAEWLMTDTGSSERIPRDPGRPEPGAPNLSEDRAPDHRSGGSARDHRQP